MASHPSTVSAEVKSLSEKEQATNIMTDLYQACVMMQGKIQADQVAGSYLKQDYIKKITDIMDTLATRYAELLVDLSREGNNKETLLYFFKRSAQSGIFGLHKELARIEQSFQAACKSFPLEQMRCLKIIQNFEQWVKSIDARLNKLQNELKIYLEKTQEEQKKLSEGMESIKSWYNKAKDKLDQLVEECQQDNFSGFRGLHSFKEFAAVRNTEDAINEFLKAEPRFTLQAKPALSSPPIVIGFETTIARSAAVSQELVLPNAHTRVDVSRKA